MYVTTKTGFAKLSILVAKKKIDFSASCFYLRVQFMLLRFDFYNGLSQNCIYLFCLNKDIFTLYHS